MNNILIVSAAYPPEPIVTSLISEALAEILCSDGNYVTVLCPYPSRGLNIKDINVIPKIKYENLEVIRLKSYRSPKSKIISRFFESLSFGLCAFYFIFKLKKKPAILYMNIWPIFSQLLISFSCIILNIPYINHIQDVYPESLIYRLPNISKNIIHKTFFNIDNYISKNATGLIFISNKIYINYTLTRNINNVSAKVIHNWTDESKYAYIPNRNDVCDYYNIKKDLVTYMFLGNVGNLAMVESMIMAYHNASIDKSQFIIVGNGDKLIKCKNIVSKLGNQNIKFISEPNINKTSYILSVAHVFIICQRNSSTFSSFPSKLISYLFSGKPILAHVDLDSDIATHVIKSSCGWVGDINNTHWLEEFIVKVSKIPLSELNIIGQYGRNYAFRNFSKSRNAYDLANYIKSFI